MRVFFIVPPGELNAHSMGTCDSLAQTKEQAEAEEDGTHIYSAPAYFSREDAEKVLNSYHGLLGIEAERDFPEDYVIVEADLTLYRR